MLFSVNGELSSGHLNTRSSGSGVGTDREDGDCRDP